ncbi:hypothetical protein [Brevifollis gellanilyticus]|uniref:Uncharacterized protein n=1 Tax=Brevifollis gellanilyticus TaxID=748831 RepID=A0A512MEX2_9BACT|nr:hypothetical protein [Brevifollis gellanilyticus]GEP44901.1 hypothetical protein BGE01nite_41920 [Brevifollis gellanilyticus]
MNGTERAMLFAGLPGADLVSDGLADVAAGRETVAGELVKIGSPRLNDCGLSVIVDHEEALNADRRLYTLLGASHGNAAHSQYNALIRQLVSFERALEQRLARARRVRV